MDLFVSILIDIISPYQNLFTQTCGPVLKYRFKIIKGTGIDIFRIYYRMLTYKTGYFANFVYSLIIKNSFYCNLNNNYIKSYLRK